MADFWSLFGRYCCKQRPKSTNGRYRIKRKNRIKPSVLRSFSRMQKALYRFQVPFLAPERNTSCIGMVCFFFCKSRELNPFQAPVSRTTSPQAFISLAATFLKVTDPLIPLRLLSAKGHARLTCSVVNAIATVRCRYQPFAGAPAARRDLSKFYNFIQTNVERSRLPKSNRLLFLYIIITQTVY